MREPLAAVVDASEMDALASDAAREFEALLDDIPYADRPEHVMALPSLAGAIVLAFYKAARARGYSAHQFGRAMHEAPLPELHKTRSSSAGRSAARRVYEATSQPSR